MTGYTSPAALPPHVLDRADVRDALARHDFGTVFRLARQWGGISFVKIADACDIKPERVGQLAKGKGSVTTYEKIAQIADALRIPGHMLGLCPREWETQALFVETRAEAPEGVGAVVASPNTAMLTDGPGTADPEGGDEVRRREFIAATLTTAGLPDALPKLTQGRRIDLGVVRRLRQRTTRLRCLDDFLGGADTFRLYKSELDSTVNLVREASYSNSTGRALLSVVAEQAQQAGWAAFDAGRHAQAQQLYKTALSAATDADDQPLAGNSLAFLAYQQVSTARSGIEFATASCEKAGSDAPATVQALLFERLAWARAMAGQAKETERALAQAEAALAQDAFSEPQPDWAAWVDRRELQIMSGRCWTELRCPLRAVPALEDALSGFDDTHARDKALYLSWLAHAYLDAGEVEQSASVIGRAIDLAVGVGSVRPQERAAAFLQRLTPHRALQPVAELLDRAAV